MEVIPSTVQGSSLKVTPKAVSAFVAMLMVASLVAVLVPRGNAHAATGVTQTALVRAANSTGGACADAAKIAWANRWNPWPSRYVVMAIGMAAACGYWIGGMWSGQAQKAWNTCWPNCPWWYAFKFW
jgi:hypothetical protein